MRRRRHFHHVAHSIVVENMSMGYKSVKSHPNSDRMSRTSVDSSVQCLSPYPTSPRHSGPIHNTIQGRGRGKAVTKKPAMITLTLRKIDLKCYCHLGSKSRFQWR